MADRAMPDEARTDVRPKDLRSGVRWRRPAALAAALLGTCGTVAVLSDGGATGRLNATATDRDDHTAEIAATDARDPAVDRGGVRPDVTTGVPTSFDVEPPSTASVPSTRPTPAEDGASTEPRSTGSLAAGGTATTSTLPILPIEPTAPRSWKARIFVFVTDQGPETIWSVDHDGQDLRLEERGLIGGPGDRFTEGAGLFDVTADGSTMIYSQRAAVNSFDVWGSELFRRDAAGNQVRLKPAGREWGRIVISPDAERYAAVDDIAVTAVVVADIDGSNEQTIPVGISPYDHNVTLAWAPDGIHLAVGLRDRVQVWNVITGDRTDLVSSVCWPQLAWSPSGDHLAAMGAVGSRRGLFLIDPSDGAITWVFSTPAGEYSCGSGFGGLAWTPDARSIVLTQRVAAGNMAVQRLDLDSGTLSTILSDPGRSFANPKIT